MKEFIGDGEELLSSQLDTCRSVLKKMIQLKDSMIIEEHFYYASITPYDIAKLTAPALTEQWVRVSPLLQPPIILSGKALFNKITKLWEKAYNVSRGRTSKGVKEAFLTQLDHLFDITSCPHKISSCHREFEGKNTHIYQ